MKKGFILICALLAMFTALPAMAQSTGVAVDGKVYVFSGGNGTYDVDGMTFILKDDEVVVVREGMEDLCLALESSSEADAVTVSGNMTYYFSVTQDDTVCTESAESTTVYVYSEDLNAASISVAIPGSAAISEAITYSCWDKLDAMRAKEYSVYAKYGLSYDVTANVLYHYGKRVRILEDVLYIDSNSSSALQWFDDEGLVDVRAERDAAGMLIGLEALSEAEFAARDLSAWMPPNVTRMEMTATSESAPTAEELAAFYEAYAAVGLRYDAERDQLFYGDKQVRYLMDIRKSNGEEPGSGKFSGELTQLVYDGGEVDVTTIRDYAHPDAEGNGKLLGLSVTEVE